MKILLIILKILSLPLSTDKKNKLKNDSPINPRTIKTFDASLKAKKLLGAITIAIIPRNTIDALYIITFKISAAEATPADIPSLNIKNALAG